MLDVRPDIRDLGPEEIARLFRDWGEPAFRAPQVLDWIFAKNIRDFTRMTNVPGTLIDKLEKRFRLTVPECRKTQAAPDGTTKFLFGLSDGHTVETVFIPEAARRTICLSTQVGCKFGCPFCVSGSKGFLRNLGPGEILGQVQEVRRLSRIEPTNIVFMGIGEPLDNLEGTTGAVVWLNHPNGLGIGARKITLSTCGLVPGILALKDLGIQVELSVSLHAVTDDLRDRLVPVNRKYPLEALTRALGEHFAATGRVITLEYALIEGVNDSETEALRLGDMARALRAKVNLIPCSPNMSPDFRPSPPQSIRVFQAAVKSRGARVTVRAGRGGEIQAACGQLAFDRSASPAAEDK